MKKNKEVLMCYDIETTGLDPYICEIIEIGAIKVYPNGKIEEFDKVINIGKPLPKKIIEITGITDDDIARGYNKEETMLEFKDFVEDVDIVIGQNHINFDNAFIEKAIPEALLHKKMFDTLHYAQHCLDLPNNSLDNLLNYYNIKFQGDRHRALDDARATLEVYYRMTKQ